jgi:hypothetical protein
LFFVPTADFLDDAPELPSDAVGATDSEGGEAATPEETVPSGSTGTGEGSLGIGGLRDESA